MTSIRDFSDSVLKVEGKEYNYFSLSKVAEKYGFDLKRLPNTLKILLENLIRHFDNDSITEEDIRSIIDWLKNKKSDKEILYKPARVLMQDFTGVPAVVDLAAMRDAMKKLGGDVNKINPLSPVDLVIDHSVQVDKFATDASFQHNVNLEFDRNEERYTFLKWGQKSFDNFRVVPPGTGICHQVNLEYLSKVVWKRDYEGREYVFPDTLVGTDSHTTMVNGVSVLAWGVGGIEAEAAMLGQSISMVIPEVIGFELTGKLLDGVTATDLVLTVTQMLRAKGVVGKFVEFFGEGIENLSLADRATISNMAPEYGATCGFFPTDNETLNYLRLSGRDENEVLLVEYYAKAQGMWFDKNTKPEFTDNLSLDVSQVKPCISGPKRPQDKILLENAAELFDQHLKSSYGITEDLVNSFAVQGEDYEMNHGDIVIAAITSCTNTSNPNVMVAAGLVAKKAIERGLTVKPWVKTSLAPGSKVVTEYLEETGVQKYLDELGFNLVGYGCTTCIGNSGPLPEVIEDTVKTNDMVVASVLSGNRNFEGRVHPLVKTNYLASPPLVVAYAIAGSMKIDITKEPVGIDKDGKNIYLKDIWPSNSEIKDMVSRYVTSDMFKKKYSGVFDGEEEWQRIPASSSETYHWDSDSTYINNPPYFEGMKRAVGSVDNIKGARLLAKLGDSVTTDHISPAGVIAKDSPAAIYLESKGVESKDFNSYGARRGNHEVMMRGTFANIRIRNELVPGVEGGYTKMPHSSEVISIYDAAMEHQKQNNPLIVIAGKEYGTGSSRDWAAKGTKLLGVKAVITESFERIHRSNLIGMGVMPFVFEGGLTRSDLNLTGDETFDIEGISEKFAPNIVVDLTIRYQNSDFKKFPIRLAVFTNKEADYIKNSGILNTVMRGFL